MEPFKKGSIEGVVVTPLRKWIDERGWLVETYREDEVNPTFHPVMAYTSLTVPGTVRGPHEHVEQSDLFVFIGPGNFKIWLWDNRKSSSTYWNKMVIYGGQDYPLQLLVPPGVVHAYQNVSSEVSVVQNYPNQLFAGKGKKFPVDEIRHEKDPNTVFKVD
jgi:dTDP-4-dehydrorhamnose 3,5-epimerase